MSFHYCKPWLPFECMAAAPDATAKAVFGVAGLALGIVAGVGLAALLARGASPPRSAAYAQVGLAVLAFGGLLLWGAWLAAVVALGAAALAGYAGFARDGGGAGAPLLGAAAAAAAVAWALVVW